MKLNKWTVGLAALGVISLPSAIQAEETQMNVVNALTSGTTISGFASGSFHYNLNTANGAVPAGGINRALKADGFNFDLFDLVIEKPLDESEWAAGYKAELWMGPDANGIGTSVAGSGTGSNFAVKQAYVNVRVPVGNGIEAKVGLFDTIIGYEASNVNANPNYTRSIGWSIEPTQHTGMLLSYQVSDIVSVSAGLAETVSATINQRPTGVNAGANNGKFDLSYLAAVAVTAPEDMGALAGSTLYSGVVYGQNAGPNGGNVPAAQADNTVNYYIGATLATPVEGLSVGLAWDYQDTLNSTAGGSASVLGLYSSFQATEKLSLHSRIEYGRLNSGYNVTGNGKNRADLWELTLTAQYDLWENVISRFEYRYDTYDVQAFGDKTPNLWNGHAFMVNLVYSF